MRVDFKSWKTAMAVILLSILPLFVFFAGPETSAPLWLGERSPVELLTAAFYAFGTVVAIVAVFRGRHFLRLFFGVWAFFCIMFFGEETSWLQHYLNYKTPDVVAEENSQGEFNLHNLEFVQGEQSDRLKGQVENILNPRTLLNSDRLFQYFFILWFAIYPILCQRGPLSRFASNRQLPYPGPRLLFFVWYPTLLCTLLIFLSHGPLAHGLNETREMFYALAIAGFVWTASRPVMSHSGNLGSVAPA